MLCTVLVCSLVLQGGVLTDALLQGPRTNQLYRMQAGRVAKELRLVEVAHEVYAVKDTLVLAADNALAMAPLVDIWSDIDFEKYRFMFPLAICVSTCAITAGIGGAALFAPILLIGFPLLGPEYPVQSPAAAVAVAILVETFGFSSGLIGYFRRNLVDVILALSFSILSVPAAVWAAQSLKLDPVTLKTLYTFLMLLLSGSFLIGDKEENNVSAEAGDDSSEYINDNDNKNNDGGLGEATPLLQVPTSANTNSKWYNRTDSKGRIFYAYALPRVTAGPLCLPYGPLGAAGVAATLFGAALTGVLGVGVGEVILPQLLRRKVPVPVAAATSTLAVTLTTLSAAVVQLKQVEQGSIPWDLVVYMVPGVLVGGQIAAVTQGRIGIGQRHLQVAIGTLFGVVGLAFAVLVLKQSGIM